jgi:hypothetical protein
VFEKVEQSSWTTPVDDAVGLSPVSPTGVHFSECACWHFPGEASVSLLKHIFGRGEVRIESLQAHRVTVSESFPCSCLGETVSTLKFAQRAKAVQNKVRNYPSFEGACRTNAACLIRNLPSDYRHLSDGNIFCIALRRCRNDRNLARPTFRHSTTSSDKGRLRGI